ncbi:MAG: mannose-6-phosphate isomerase [Clostridia bacterium]|nr:mannose-6-phosphate isomerase [Clostridia bacterium]
MKRPLLQTENRVFRTYRGGKLLETFLSKPDPADSFQPEDWISSFVEAKNKNAIKGEGISRVLTEKGEMPITEAVTAADFGPGRTESGVLVKYLNSAERLGIQVHPTPDFSRRYFGTNYGKTECWHILETDGDAAVYIGFREGITKESWATLFHRQDIAGMLDCLHRFPVKKGDTVLVRAGTPHAIGAGCFLLEIQEPTDYTMRLEKVTVAGEALTPMQIHYGVGEEALLECFIYEGLGREEAREKFFLEPQDKNGVITLVSYADTACFSLAKLQERGTVTTDSFVTLVITKSGGLLVGGERLSVKKGEKWFVPYGCGQIIVESGEVIVCYPPKI